LRVNTNEIINAVPLNSIFALHTPSSRCSILGVTLLICSGHLFIKEVSEAVHRPQGQLAMLPCIKVSDYRLRTLGFHYLYVFEFFKKKNLAFIPENPLLFLIHKLGFPFALYTTCNFKASDWVLPPSQKECNYRFSRSQTISNLTKFI
jgi:hypothetical protein